jgi:hypothetical protein
LGEDINLLVVSTPKFELMVGKLHDTKSSMV